MLNGNVERYEDEVVCVLEDGYKLRFWDMTLTDNEYIKRTNYCKSLEKSGLMR